MSTPQFVRTAKRTIQRRRSRISIQGVTNAVIDDILATITEAKTLTRTRITGEVIYNGAADNASLALAVHILRNGNQVMDTLSVAESLDNAEPLEVILRDAFAGGYHTAAGVQIPSRVEIDTKAQRKLKPGDLIHHSVIANGATSQFDVRLEVTQWFKLA